MASPLSFHSSLCCLLSHKAADLQKTNVGAAIAVRKRWAENRQKKRCCQRRSIWNLASSYWWLCFSCSAPSTPALSSATIPPSTFLNPPPILLFILPLPLLHLVRFAVWFGWVWGRSVFYGFGLFDWIWLVLLQGLRDLPTGLLLLIGRRRFWYRNLGWMYVHWSSMSIYLAMMCLTLIRCVQVWIFPRGKSWRGTALRLRSDYFAWYLRPRIIRYP